MKQINQAWNKQTNQSHQIKSNKQATTLNIKQTTSTMKQTNQTWNKQINNYIHKLIMKLLNQEWNKQINHVTQMKQQQH